MITELLQSLRRASVRLENGKAELTDSGEAQLYVKRVEHRPLSQEEKIAELHVAAEDWNCKAELDSVDLDALEGAIHAIQEAQND